MSRYLVFFDACEGWDVGDSKADRLLWRKSHLRVQSVISSGFCHPRFVGDEIVPRSVLEAIKDGNWDYEPETTETTLYSSTKALPGTDEKLEILANRVHRGLPLWHPSDRRSYDDRDID